MITIEARKADEVRDDMRALVLRALDTAVVRAANSLGITPDSATPGATDADLPELFRALDAQLSRALARLGLQLA